MSWRAMQPTDIKSVFQVSGVVHPTFPEGEFVFRERLQLYPDGCKVLVFNERCVGYVLSHPWIYGKPPKLDDLLRAIPEEPTTYYIHDLAILPEARGKGITVPIVEALKQHARLCAFSNMSLVAVNGSDVFWKRFDFNTVALEGIETKLQSYGDNAQFMKLEFHK